MTAPELDDVLAAIANRATALREAGVTRVQAREVVIDIAPLPQKVEEIRRQRDLESSDPLLDPATYGLGNGRVPGFPRAGHEEMP